MALNKDFLEQFSALLSIASDEDRLIQYKELENRVKTKTAEFQQLHATITRDKAAAEKEAKDRNLELTIAAENHRARQKAAEDAHGKRLKAAEDHAKEIVDKLGEQIGQLQKEVGELSRQRDALKAEVAALREKFAEAGSRL